jgi:hypothetical protein
VKGVGSQSFENGKLLSKGGSAGEAERFQRCSRRECVPKIKGFTGSGGIAVQAKEPSTRLTAKYMSQKDKHDSKRTETT